MELPPCLKSRAIIFIIFFTAMVTVVRLYGESFDLKSKIITISPTVDLNTVVPGQLSNASYSFLTSLSWIRNGKRKGGLQIKEHTGTLKSCLNPSEIPNVRIEARKDETTLDHVHVEIFGDLLPKARYAAGIANKTLPTIMRQRRTVKEAASSIDQMISEMNMAVDVEDYRVLPGGHWIPLSCRPLWKVAIVLGFRNRYEHLPIFLRHTVPLLKRQQLEFSIFISEQRNNLLFNKAMLMNIGFIEALNFSDYDCVVFHDIDHLALNVGNYYGCESMPKHFESGEPRWNWGLPYQELFGGAAGVTTSQFHAINGLPNVYWGWGGEDDDFYYRVIASGFKPSRPEGEIGFFDTIEHDSTVASPLNRAKFCLLSMCHERMSTDGISNLVYESPNIELQPLYTNISVNIQKLPWNPNWRRCELITTIIISIMMIAILILLWMLFIRFRSILSTYWNCFHKKLKEQSPINSLQRPKINCSV